MQLIAVLCVQEKKRWDMNRKFSGSPYAVNMQFDIINIAYEQE